MPKYYKRKSYNYRGKRRYSYKKARRPLFGRLDMAAYKMARKALQFVNTEFKAFDVTNSSITPGEGSGDVSFQVLNLPTEGNDIDNRSGRSIMVKSVQCYFNTNLHASATATRMRWTLFIDKQPRQANPSQADIYTDALRQFRNLDNRKRFVILKSGTVDVNTDFPEKTRKFYRKFHMHTIYNATSGGTIADIQSNALFMMFSSDETTNFPTVDFRARIRFLDN